MTDEYKSVLERALKALCLTHDYIGADMLPSIEGWEWYESGKEIAELIPDSEWAFQFWGRVENIVQVID